MTDAQATVGAAMTLRLVLPWPPKELSPNARVHYMKKAKVVADFREECGWIGREGIQLPSVTGMRLHDSRRYPLRPPVRARVTFVVPDRRRRDIDNLLAMLKPAWDGLTDAGVLEGDDAERFSVESTEVVVSHNVADVNKCSWCMTGKHRRCHGPCNCMHGKSYVVVELQRG